MKRNARVRLFVSFFLLFGICLAACQTGGKDQKTWKETLTASALPVYRYDVPENVSERWESKSGKMDVTFNAEVVKPAQGEYPVLQVEPRPMDDELAERVYRTFVNGKALNKVSSASNVQMYYLRKDLENIERYHQQLLSDETSFLNKLKLTDVAEYEKAKRRMESLFGYFRSLMEEMPAGYSGPPEADRLQFDFFTDNSDHLADAIYLVSSNKTCSGTIDYHQITKSVFTLSWTDAGIRSCPATFLSIDDFSREQFQENTEDLQGLVTTYAQALHTARNCLEKLGIDYMQLDLSAKGITCLSDGYDPKPCYLFCFSRGSGALIERNRLQLKEQISWSSASSDWNQESIWIGVDDQGIFECTWRYPSRLKEVVNSNVLIMPFAQMMERGKETLDRLAKSYRTDTYVLVHDSLNVSKVELVLCKVLDSETNNYYLVPAWNFYGAITRKFKIRADVIQPHLLDENNVVVYEGEDLCLFTINAIDGSFIDRIENY